MPSHQRARNMRDEGFPRQQKERNGGCVQARPVCLWLSSLHPRRTEKKRLAYYKRFAIATFIQMDICLCDPRELAGGKQESACEPLSLIARSLQGVVDGD